MTETNFIDRPVEGRLYRICHTNSPNNAAWPYAAICDIDKEALDALLPGDTALLDDGRQLTRLA
ncbi:hypothetical protein KEM14_gp21 [Xanthomonas virus phiXaf18]|uniref:Uncharacterized protein n=2 Tax=Beograduvirus TaxID=2946820 RepID=A0A3G1GLC3_9CAUD|nr:hypothetical protein KEM13_gp08 [Xanthomonas phage KPhi1]YP_010052645.1 hypothetical protein KEM14_gp21 [Xanthomonas virus phiXaf18]APQ41887.1 hypothetical protein K1pha_8 [Xanthomonas phage KPhi1]QFR59583.1 hypothetical protein phiXaf18_21 [Xanthomonas virus phiXaf18]